MKRFTCYPRFRPNQATLSLRSVPRCLQRHRQDRAALARELPCPLPRSRWRGASISCASWLLRLPVPRHLRVRLRLFEDELPRHACWPTVEEHHDRLTLLVNTPGPRGPSRPFADGGRWRDKACTARIQGQLEPYVCASPRHAAP